MSEGVFLGFIFLRHLLCFCFYLVCENLVKSAAEIQIQLLINLKFNLSPYFLASAFVEKYRMKLIGNVPDPDPLLDLLRHKKVLSDHSYSEIKALPTDDRKMSQLLMGPYLKTKPSCDIFYDYLKKEHPYLVLDLLQN